MLHSYSALTVLVATLLLLPPSQAQEDVLILDDDSQFGGDIDFDGSAFDDFSFDDSAIFADAFDTQASTDGSSWLEHFTIKLSQQVFGQVNNHGVDIAPGFSFPREAKIENNRLGVNIRYQNPFASGWLLQASAQSKLYWNKDYEYVANGNQIDTEYRNNEFFIQRSFNRHSVKFGRQTVVWGETVGNSVLDVINTSEFRDLSIIDIEDARLNQLMVVWDYFAQDSSFSTFVNLYPEFNPAAVRGSPFFFEPAFNLTDYNRDEALFEVGSQWKKSFEGSDIAIMAAYLIENQLRYEDPITGIGDAVSKKNDFWLLGFSANKAIGKLLLNFDLALSHNVLADSFNFPGTTSLGSSVNLRKDQIGTSFGFEYAISNYQSISIGIQAQRLLDEDEGLLPEQMLINDGVFGSGLMRYSNTMLNGDLVFSSTLQGGLDGESLLAMFGLNYIFDDKWAINGQIISISAKANSALSYFAEDIRIGTTVTYTF